MCHDCIIDYIILGHIRARLTLLAQVPLQIVTCALTMTMLLLLKINHALCPVLILRMSDATLSYLVTYLLLFIIWYDEIVLVFDDVLLLLYRILVGLALWWGVKNADLCLLEIAFRVRWFLISHILFVHCQCLPDVSHWVLRVHTRVGPTMLCYYHLRRLDHLLLIKLRRRLGLDGADRIVSTRYILRFVQGLSQWCSCIKGLLQLSIILYYPGHLLLVNIWVGNKLLNIGGWLAGDSLLVDYLVSRLRAALSIRYSATTDHRSLTI